VIEQGSQKSFRPVLTYEGASLYKVLDDATTAVSSHTAAGSFMIIVVMSSENNDFNYLSLPIAPTSNWVACRVAQWFF